MILAETPMFLPRNIPHKSLDDLNLCLEGCAVTVYVDEFIQVHPDAQTSGFRIVDKAGQRSLRCRILAVCHVLRPSRCGFESLTPTLRSVCWVRPFLLALGQVGKCPSFPSLVHMKDW